ncbi:hypothetical protein RND81_09G044600 [Saponaria officinalis]|uniref:Stigma-specific STIG1-like protein 1 n=1 Tax=Saponaria officinalis TaxID=3572 RepID=A0AAW1IIR0_SAPOF
MRKMVKSIFLVVSTLAMVIVLGSLTITYDNHPQNNNNNIDSDTNRQPSLVLPSKRVSRFLAQNGNYGSTRNPKAADHCNKDNEICTQQGIAYGTNSTCCNNKCMDLNEDDKNCGACKNKCKYTQHCCRGQCVNLAYDPRFCGSCYNKCKPKQYCVYGICDYA